MTTPKPSPLLPACKLWRKESANGRVYYVGRLGSMRVLILENTRSETEADGTHTLLFGEATKTAPRPSEPAAHDNGASYQAARPRRTSRGADDVRHQPLPQDLVPF